MLQVETGNHRGPFIKCKSKMLSKQRALFVEDIGLRKSFMAGWAERPRRQHVFEYVPAERRKLTLTKTVTTGPDRSLRTYAKNLPRTTLVSLFPFLLYWSGGSLVFLRF